MTPHLDVVLEFLPFGTDPLPSHRLRQWKRRLDVDGNLAIKPEAAVKGRIPIDQDSRLMAAQGMPDGVIHQFRGKPLALMGGGYGKGSKNPTHHWLSWVVMLLRLRWPTMFCLGAVITQCSAECVSSVVSDQSSLTTWMICSPSPAGKAAR